MSKTVRLSVRLNMDNSADRQAWERLRNIDRAVYKSCNKAIVTAINDYFDRQERMSHDSYLETREKEDAFLQMVLDTITQGMTAAAPMNALISLIPLLQGTSTAPIQGDDESMDAALDFANSF